MKKYILLFLAVLSVTCFISCDFEEDINDFTPPNYVTFEGSSFNVKVLEGESNTLDVTVYAANITDTDRTYNLITSDATTLGESVYDFPSSITIPANSNEATFTVNLSDNGLPNAGGKLVLSLENTGDYSVGDPATIKVAKVCPFDINRFVGTFDATEVFTAGGNEGYSFLGGDAFPIELSVNPDDASGNSLLLTDANGFISGGSTVLTFDADGNLTLPDDLSVFGYPLVVSSTNTDTCNEQLSFTGGLANYGEYTVTLQKQ